jgi:hypothetical protein
MKDNQAKSIGNCYSLIISMNSIYYYVLSPTIMQ